jgi:hypothetical protein
MLYAKQHRINYMWYLGFTESESGITVMLHDRLRCGLAPHPHPETEMLYDTVEDDRRIITHVKLFNGTSDLVGRTVRVLNPEHIFDYPKF